jgi:hypothetical protein
MKLLRNNSFSKTSIIIGAICFLNIFILNILIAIEYANSGKKDQAYFFLNELRYIYPKLVIGIVIFVALLLLTIGAFKKEQPKQLLLSLLLIVLTILFIFLKVWKVFV